MTDQEIRVIEQLASTPAQRVALTLAAEHAARTGAIRTLTLDELDMPNPRITLNGYHQRLGELTHRVLTAWLDHRRATWPLTPNRHVLLNAKTVPRTEALVMTAIEENIVLSIPSTAPARAAALIPAGHELGLDVLLSLPCTVIDELDTAHARARWAPCCNTAATHRATSRLPTLFTAHKNEVGRL